MDYLSSLVKRAKVRSPSPRRFECGAFQGKQSSTFCRFTCVIFLMFLVVQISLVFIPRLHSYTVPNLYNVSSIDTLKCCPKSSTGLRHHGRMWKLQWLKFPIVEFNETDQLMDQWRALKYNKCHGVQTQSVQVIGGLPELLLTESPSSSNTTRIRLAAGPIHEVVWASIDQDGKRRCTGGDFFETDLSGPRWKSRPPVLDRNDGTYTMALQLHPNFTGVHHLNVTLLFDNLQGLNFRTQRHARLKQVLALEIESFQLELPRSEPSSNSKPSLPDLEVCTKGDFSRKHWTGRWTREEVHECPVDERGRYDCLDSSLKCSKPWCEGPVARLESSGWVYSAHCAFRIFEPKEAWQCLNNKWLFAWGDSNMGDTLRNLLKFVLGFNDSVGPLPRRTDQVFSSPRDARLSVRITSIFNGNHNESSNWEGLFSLHDEEYQNYLRSFFTDGEVPDFMIMNSGLHDGLYWRNTEEFLRDGVEPAMGFWKGVWDEMKPRQPEIIYRTTIAPAGRHRPVPNNPQKMEFYNHVIVDQLMKLNLPKLRVVDGFDLTFPWHYGNRHSDGVHYGRPPSNSKWVDGQIGHQYFVDLMLVHILLNSMCGA